MAEPIHSRGTGRSGPKRKTGCLTCRRRKVRCDEAKPVCANCVRLRLDCGYVKERLSQLSSPQSVASVDNIDVNDRRKLPSAAQTSPAELYQPPRFQAPQPMPPPNTLPYGTQGQLWNIDSEPTPGYAPPFQDIFFSSLDSFNVGLDFANSDAFLGPDLISSSTGFPPNVAGAGNSAEASSTNEKRRKVLIEHFVQSANPVSVILPTHTEWTSACRSLLAMATDSVYLLSAICALSALHLYTTKDEDCLDEAFGNYKSSSRSVNAVLDHPQVNDRQLKQAFATVFLLTHVEVSWRTSKYGFIFANSHL